MITLDSIKICFILKYVTHHISHWSVLELVTFTFLLWEAKKYQQNYAFVLKTNKINLFTLKFGSDKLVFNTES